MTKPGKDSPQVLPLPSRVKAEWSDKSMYLHFNVEGKDRLFILDSADNVSWVNPARWGNTNPSVRFPIDLKIKGVTVAKVFAFTADRLLYKTKTEPPFSTYTIDGVLGNDFLDQVTLLADVRNSRAFIWSKQHATVYDGIRWWNQSQGLDLLFNTSKKMPWFNDGFASGWRVLPLTFTTIGEAMVRGTIHGRDMRLVLDTGSTNSSLQPFRESEVAGQKIGELSADLYASHQPLTLSLISDARIGPIYQGLIAMNTLPPGYNVDFDAVAGLDLLNKSAWVIDRKGRNFAICPYSEVGETICIGTVYRLLNNKLYFVWNPFVRESEVTSINGKDPKAVFTFPSVAITSAERYKLLARQLKELIARSNQPTLK